MAIKNEHGVVTTAAGAPVGESNTANVKNYGAKGRGASDDTNAIIKAIQQSNGGSVYLPTDIYSIKVTTSSEAIIPINQKYLRLVGDGPGRTIVRVADNCSDYKTIMGGKTNSSDFTGFECCGITFDHNVDGNPINENTITEYGQASIRIFKGTDINIHHCGVINSSSINNFVVNGLVKEVRINDNRFSDMGDDPNHAAHDASAIYVHAEGIQIKGNVFDSVVTNPGTVTAIETHGGKCVVFGNIINGCKIGMNITGVSAMPSKAIDVYGNTITDCEFGTILWSRKHGIHTSGYGLDAVSVFGNTIMLADSIPGWSAGNQGGIVVEPNSDLDIRGLNITANVITASKNAPTGVFAIGWESSRTLRDSYINGNTISGFTTPTRFTCTLDNAIVQTS